MSRVSGSRGAMRFVVIASAALLGACATSTNTSSALSTPSISPVAAAPAQPMTMLDPSARSELDRELLAVMNTPGKALSSVAALAIRDGRVVYANAFGHAFIDPSDPTKHRAATTDSLYRIASISKLVTAVAVAKLADEGRIDLDRDVSEYFGYRVRNPHFPDAKITLRLLMTHTSSLRDAGGYNFPERVNLRDVLVPGGTHYGKGAMWSKERAPGNFFSYCNFGWGLIATAMERATGERFDRLMERLLFAPLGVTATFDPAALAPDKREQLATLYRKRSEINGKETWNSEGPWVPQVDDFSKEPPKPRSSDTYVIGSNGSLYGPQGGARISANDLAKLMLMLMNGGQHEGHQVLPQKAVALLLSEQWRFDRTALAGKGNRAEDDEGEGGLFNAWALGPQIFLDISNGKARGDRIVEGGGFTGVGHLGNAYGLTSAFIFDPKKKNGLIFIAGGTAADPEHDKGAFSAFYRYEERILTALHRSALQTR